MNIIIVLLLADLFITTVSFESCSGNFCPPVWRKLKITPEEMDGTGSVLIMRDEESGCTCREFPKLYSFCFGRQTCRLFPKNVNISTIELRIRATQIVEIRPGDLVNLTHLEDLKIEGNFNLSRILSGTFLNMTKLKNLSISYNANLQSLENGSLDGLVNLEQLFLVKNGFVKLAVVTSTIGKLPKLKKLELSENNFSKITKDEFEPMRNCPLEELNLILCQIEEMEPQVFNPLTNLMILRLGENIFNIDTITKVIEEAVKHVPLKFLNLYAIGLRKSPPKSLMMTVAKSNITYLCLARNQFEIINSKSFPKMPNLQILDLREVLTLNITNNAFIELPNLKTLLLSGNKLSSIPEGVLLEQLTYLDLQQNSGNRNSPSYFSIYGQKFINMKNLELLDLSYNAIHVIYNSSFVGLTKLRILGLKNGTIYHICNGSFAMLKNLVFLNLENNHFVKSHPWNFGPKFFVGLDNLQVLLLGGCGISFLRKSSNPFQGLQNLIHLGLERNHLVTFDGFDILPNLKTLDLSENNLQPWNERIFNQNHGLKDIRLNGNKFTYLTDAMVEDFEDLVKVELIDNPFTCDCSFSWNTKKMMDLIKNQTIFCAFPDSSLTIQEFLHGQHDCQNLALVLPLVLTIILLVVTFVTLYYYRWHWRYWLFLTRLYLSQKNQNLEKNAYTNYTYDAFISYSNEDRNFVLRLVTMLENYPPFIKLCVYERDFEIGTMISENILESVSKSRKIILIISDSYAKSLWCRWESQIAEHHRLFLQNEDSLIMIKLGPVNESHLTPTLKFLLKTRIYLQWDSEEKKQRVFWEKLRTILAPPQEINENTHL